MLGSNCGKCGYGNKAAGSVDVDWWRCADVRRGLRCSKAGGLAHGTHGGGPYYCRDHFSSTEGASDASTPPSGFRHLRVVCEEVAPR